MRSAVGWSDQVPKRENRNRSVWDICFNPDGSQMIVAVTNRVLVYDAVDANLLQSLRGHKDTVYSVAYAQDGKRFASGGADNSIIVWSSEADGLLKYAHNEAIQKLAFNPVTSQLVSCSVHDFGLWSPAAKSVKKHKVPSRILSCDWTKNGQFLALGMFNGNVSIRMNSGEQKLLIEKNAPVWCLKWDPTEKEAFDTLAVGCWDQTLSFYNMNGGEIGVKPLGYNPCDINYYINSSEGKGGAYLLVGGSNKKVSLMTVEGVKLSDICVRDSWIWTCTPRPYHNYIAVGTNDGNISMHQLLFSTVHAMYQDRYACRDNMTDVVVQHLITDKKVKIKHKDYVEKVAVYKDRLAVQLADRVVIYELTPSTNSYSMRYRTREKIRERLKCNLLAVTSLHLVVCLDSKIQLLSFNGYKEREWVFEQSIRYIKNIGGPQGREGLLVGLKDGMVLKIFIDNPFPIKLISKQKEAIRCLDLSASRKKLAVIDGTNSCSVYDLISRELIFKEENAESVAWNTELEDMLCLSGEGCLTVKTGTFPVHARKQKGVVVSFSGSKIFCLDGTAMVAVDMPHSQTLYRYLEEKDYDMAYTVACLGVTEADWKLLGMKALYSMNLDVAHKAFVRVRNLHLISLVESIRRERSMTDLDPESAKAKRRDQIFVARVYACEGKYKEAAKLFEKHKATKKAIEMFSDLWMWDEAKKIAARNPNAVGSKMFINHLNLEHAKTLEARSEWRKAAEQYCAADDYNKAIAIFNDQQDPEGIMTIARKLDQEQYAGLLNKCAKMLIKFESYHLAKEIYKKVNNTKALMALFVQIERWDEAFALLKKHPGQYEQDVYMPFAEYLCKTDHFEEAQEAYRKAGMPNQALKILQQLTHNAVVERRLQDAAYFSWLLAAENMKMVRSSGAAKQVESKQSKESEENKPSPDTEGATQWLKSYKYYKNLAQLYYGFHYIQQYVDAPFTAMVPEALFNISRFLLNRLGNDQPFGISRVYIMFTMAKHANTLEAYKLAREAYKKLQKLHIPAPWVEQIDLSMLKIQGKAYSDKQDLLPICYRCASVNPLINLNIKGGGDICITCGHPIIRSFSNFDALPLVEFTPNRKTSVEDAIRLINEMPPQRKGGSVEKWSEDTNVQTMAMGDDDEDEPKDAFVELLRHFDARQNNKSKYRPVQVDKKVLKSMEREEVFIVNPELAGMNQKGMDPLLKTRFFKNLIPDMNIRLCAHCGHFFHEDDFELLYLEKGHCPFCRKKDADMEGVSTMEELQALEDGADADSDDDN